MVISVDIPLKASEEAIVNFLLRIVFAPRKMNNQTSRRQLLQHDVYGACKLISWIARKDRANPRCLTFACNLVYGNTIVLSQQVARLLIDAHRARDIVAFTSYLAEEEERRRRTREQMKGDDLTTPKKKRRSKAVDDDYLLVPPTPLRMALRQDITMADVVGIPVLDNINIEDDLAPPTMEEFEMLYGMLNSENMNNPSEMTFIDRYSSLATRRQDILNETMDFQRPPPLEDVEFDRPTNDFIRNQLETPTKTRNPAIAQDDELFEPHSALADILRFGRLPILDEKRRSMEEEMEDARHRGINQNTEMIEQSPIEILEVPRVASMQMELDEDVIIPPNMVTPRAPRALRGALLRTPLDTSAVSDDAKHRIPLKEMHLMMENFSSLHYATSAPLLPKPKKTPLSELMSTIPPFLRGSRNPVVLESFPRKGPRFDAHIGTGVESEDVESIEQARHQKEPTYDLDNLEPIDLAQIKFVETPLKTNSPIMSPLRRIDDFDMDLEQPRREDFDLQNPISPLRFQDDGLMDGPISYNNTRMMDFDNSPRIESNPDDKTSAMIRKSVFSECDKHFPFRFALDSLLDVNKTSRREAARYFYVVLELLKEREIKVSQVSADAPIDIERASNEETEDVEELAMLELDHADF